MNLVIQMALLNAKIIGRMKIVINMEMLVLLVFIVRRLHNVNLVVQVIHCVKHLCILLHGVQVVVLCITLGPVQPLLIVQIRKLLENVMTALMN